MNLGFLSKIYIVLVDFNLGLSQLNCIFSLKRLSYDIIKVISLSRYLISGMTTLCYHFVCFINAIIGCALPHPLLFHPGHQIVQLSYFQILLITRPRSS